MITNAALDIWEGKGVSPVLKYEDDLNAFCYPSAGGPFTDGDFHYDYDCTRDPDKDRASGHPSAQGKGQCIVYAHHNLHWIPMGHPSLAGQSPPCQVTQIPQPL